VKSEFKCEGVQLLVFRWEVLDEQVELFGSTAPGGNAAVRISPEGK
jgi:hypothetical protein